MPMNPVEAREGGAEEEADDPVEAGLAEAEGHRPVRPVTLVAVKKMRTASGTMMMRIVRNWRFKNASAPSWMARAISCILSVP